MKTYLGDSVYAELDGNSVVLTTENGYPDDPRNKIVLDPLTYAALIYWVKSLKWGEEKEGKAVGEG